PISEAWEQVRGYGRCLAAATENVGWLESAFERSYAKHTEWAETFKPRVPWTFTHQVKAIGVHDVSGWRARVDVGAREAQLYVAARAGAELVVQDSRGREVASIAAMPLRP